MTVPTDEWGRRLSDALRGAIERGDFVAAQRLALEGDGQTRSLATEYTLMVRGLGITIKILLRLTGETLANAVSDRGDAAADLGKIVGAFRRDLDDLQDKAAASAGALGETLRSIQSWFDREQTRLANEIVAAIEQEEAARALDLLDAKDVRQYLPLHDRLVRFMAESFGWVLRWFGPHELVRFHLATAEAQRQGFEKWEALPPAEFARTSAFLLKQHMGTVSVSEDADKFTIEQAPCGSGGRLCLDGAYEGTAALPFVETPGPLTFGEPRLPVYCSHCAIWNGAAPLRWFGHAQWFFESPSQPTGACTLHIYKQAEAAPKDYAARVAVASKEG